MTNKEISELLEEKFQGVRKDSLSSLALMVTMLPDEEAKKFIESLDEGKVNNFVAEDRRAKDTEIAKSIKSSENRLREKFDFVEKKNDPQTIEQSTQTQTQQPDIAEIIKQALLPMQTEINNMKAEKVSANRLETLNGLLVQKQNLPQAYKDLVISNFKNLSFADDNAFNDFMESQKSNIASFEQSLANSALGGHKPVYGSVGNDGVSEGVKNYIASKTSDEFKGKEV